MSVKPIQSEKDLVEYLSTTFDPVSLSIKKVNESYKANLVFKDNQVTKLFRVLKSKFIEVDEL